MPHPQIITPKNVVIIQNFEFFSHCKKPMKLSLCIFGQFPSLKFGGVTSKIWKVQAKLASSLLDFGITPPYFFVI